MPLILYPELFSPEFSPNLFSFPIFFMPAVVKALSCVRRNNRSRKPAKSSLDGIHTQEMIHRFCGPGRSAYRENYQRLSLP